MRKTATILVVFATVAMGAGSALAASITSIGALSDPGAMSKVYAMSPDGNWAVGESPDAAGVPQAVVWSAGSGLVQLPNPGGLATSARGVVVMGNGDIAIAGYTQDGTFTPYRMGAYRVPPSNLTGGTWYPHIQHNVTVGAYNAARMYENGTGNTFTIAGQRGVGARGIQTYETGTEISGSYSDSGVLSGYARVYNVSSRVPTGSARGYAAGYERDTTTQLRRALFGITGSTQTVIPGSAGYESEALGISPQTTADAGSGVIVGYDRDTTANLKHAFYYPQGGAGMILLSELAGDNQSEAIDVRIVGGSTFIGGWSSDGVTEKAVVWTNGSPASLAGLLGTFGVDTSAWSSLSRITSMSDDGNTVAGWGVWAVDGSTRGFVAVIPEPATISLLVLGACVLFRRRR
jgi:hypothetical protein